MAERGELEDAIIGRPVILAIADPGTESRFDTRRRHTRSVRDCRRVLQSLQEEDEDGRLLNTHKSGKGHGSPCQEFTLLAFLSGLGLPILEEG